MMLSPTLNPKISFKNYKSLLIWAVLLMSSSPLAQQKAASSAKANVTKGSSTDAKANLKTDLKAAPSEAKNAAPDAKLGNSEYIIETELSTVILRLSHNIIGRFESTGKGGLKGKIELVGGKTLQAAKLDFSPDTFDSLISLRDDHIKKEYLETAKFPLISLLNGTTPITSYKEREASNWKDFSASLVVKDTPAEVKGRSRLFLEDGILKGSVEFSSKISSFPIKTPTYKGVGVEDAVSIYVDLVARPDFGDEDFKGL